MVIFFLNHNFDAFFFRNCSVIGQHLIWLGVWVILCEKHFDQLFGKGLSMHGQKYSKTYAFLMSSFSPIVSLVAVASIHIGALYGFVMDGELR